MHRSGLELVKVGKRRQVFSSGDVIPETGIYRVHHSEHHLSDEVTALKGQLFPACANCSNAVRFELLRSISIAESDSDFRVVLHSLPVFEERKAEKKRRAS